METTETDLHQLVENYAKAVNDMDLDLAERIWSQTKPISFIHPRGHNTGWEKIRDNFYVGTMGNFSKRSLQPRDISVNVVDENNAWGEFYWTFDATFNDGMDITTDGRETQVWCHEADCWKILHVHYSAMPVTGEREGF